MHAYKIQVTHLRIFMVIIYSTNESNRVAYTMETIPTKQALWNIRPRSRESDIITIGNIFIILNNISVGSFITRHVSILVINYSFFIMNRPTFFMNFLIHKDLEDKSTMYFHKNLIDVHTGPPIALNITCAGRVCDRQCVNDRNGKV